MATQQDSLLLILQQMQAREDRAEREAQEREDKARREAQEKEDRLKRESEEREERMLRMFGKITTAAMAASEKQTETQREKLLQDQHHMEVLQDQAKKEAERRTYEFSQTQEQAKKDRLERERQE